MRRGSGCRSSRIVEEGHEACLVVDGRGGRDSSSAAAIGRRARRRRPPVRRIVTFHRLHGSSVHLGATAVERHGHAIGDGAVRLTREPVDASSSDGAVAGVDHRCAQDHLGSRLPLTQNAWPSGVEGVVVAESSGEHRRCRRRAVRFDAVADSPPSAGRSPSSVPPAAAATPRLRVLVRD